MMEQTFEKPFLFGWLPVDALRSSVDRRSVLTMALSAVCHFVKEMVSKLAINTPRKTDKEDEDEK